MPAKKAAKKAADVKKAAGKKKVDPSPEETAPAAVPEVWRFDQGYPK